MAFTPLPASQGISQVSAAAVSSLPPEVLGMSTADNANQRLFMMAYALLVGIYVSGRSYQRRREIVAFVYNNRKRFGPVGVALRSILLKVGPLLSFILSFGKHR